MIKNKIFILLNFLIIYSLSNANSYTNIERRRQLNDLREERRERYKEIEEALKYPDNNNFNYRDTENLIDKELNNDEKFLIKKIVIENYFEKDKKVKEIIKNYENTFMDKNEILALITKLSEVHLEKGEVTSLFTLKGGNIKTGVLILEFKEGKINDIFFKEENNENKIRDILKIKSGFPNMKSKRLNIKNIDQGLENLNTSSWRNEMIIQASDKEGYSDIIIERLYTPTGISLGIDNSSFKDKGRYKVNLGFTQDGVIGYNDTLRFTYSTRLTEDRNKDYEDSYGIGYSFPIGNWNFGINYDIINNYSTIEGLRGDYSNKNKSWKNKYKISRILQRNQLSKTTLKYEINIKKTKNYIRDALLEVNSKVYANFKTGIDHVNKIYGGNIFLGLEYERGIPLFGGEKDIEYVSDASKVEFDKYNLNISWEKSFPLKSENSFSYKFDFGGSYSEDRLLSANAFSLGDEYTVRGFKESSVTGQKGFYINNTLNFYLSRNKYPLLSKFQPFIGLDIGASRDRDLENSDRLMGTAIGVRYSTSGLSTSLTYSSVIRRAHGMPKEGNPIYFNISYQI